MVGTVGTVEAGSMAGQGSGGRLGRFGGPGVWGWGRFGGREGFSSVFLGAGLSVSGGRAHVRRLERLLIRRRGHLRAVVGGTESNLRSTPRKHLQVSYSGDGPHCCRCVDTSGRACVPGTRVRLTELLTRGGCGRSIIGGTRTELGRVGGVAGGCSSSRVRGVCASVGGRERTLMAPMRSA